MEIKKIIDVSRIIYPGMAVWPGDGNVELNRCMSIKSSDIVNLTSIKMSLHTGTHIDAPFHFIDAGSTIESLDLSRFIGFVKVFELDVEDCITAASIRNLPINKDDMVLFKTKNSLLLEDGTFSKNYIYIDESAAKLLIDKGIKTIGVDYLSVDKYASHDYPAHLLFLSNSIGIIEGLYLKNVKEGNYFFSCLPLRIDGVDGSPARAVLIEV